MGLTTVGGKCVNKTRGLCSLLFLCVNAIKFN